MLLFFFCLFFSSVLYQPLHFLFVKVDVNLFVIINILFVWFVFFFLRRMQHSGEC